MNYNEYKYRTNKLPDFDYQYQTSLFGNWNNQLLAGINQGLSLYDRDTDTQLYKTIDYKPIDTMTLNFDDINKKLDENENENNSYNNGKSFIKGIVDKVNDVGTATENNINELKNIFQIDNKKIFEIAAVIFVGILLYKKV